MRRTPPMQAEFRPIALCKLHEWARDREEGCGTIENLCV